MAETVGGANIRIFGDALGFISALSEAKKQAGVFAKEVNATVGRAYRDAETQQKAFRGGLLRLGNDLQSMGKKMAVFGSLPALFAAGSAYKTFADLERLKIGLAQYGESIKTVRELAKLPNVSIEGAAQSLLQLRAVGVESKFAQRSITAFANALTAAGKSSNDLNPALTNIVQMLSTGVISAADVKELANRVPQARKALIDAFGTASGEELTKKGVAKVVEALIAQLEKIPPVAGGAAMALEKLGDDAKFGLAAIGEALDKSFNITGTIGELSNLIGDLTEKFTQLDPKTQKAAFAFAGMAVIIPTLITAIGGAATILSLFATGIGVATGTVLGISAAVAVAGTAIIANWGDVKESVGDTGVWKTLADIGGSTLNALVELFKVAANLITADWENMGISLSNLLKNLGNLSVKIFGGIAKILPSMMGTLFGVDTSALTNGIDQLVKAMQIEVPKSASIAAGAIEKLRAKFSDLVGGIGDIPKTGGKGKGAGNEPIPKPLTELGFINWQIDLESRFLKERKAVKDATDQYKELVGVVKSLNVERKGLSNNVGLQLSNPMTDDVKINRAFAGVSPKSWAKSKEKLSAVADYRMPQTIDSITNQANKYYASSNIRRQASSELNDFFGGQYNLDEVRKYFDQFTKIAGETDQAYADRIYSIVDRTKALSAGLSSALQNAAADVAYGFGEMLGNLMSGAGGVENFGKRVLTSLAGLLKEMGKSLIGFGTAGIALKVFAKNPYLALAAGIGLVALGTAAQNKINSQAEGGLTKFAEGGVAYRKMVAVVGDNRNARHDPEIIAPYSKIDKSIEKSIKGVSGNGFEPGQIVAEFKIRGEDLYGVLKNVDARNNSIYGL